MNLHTTCDAFLVLISDKTKSKSSKYFENVTLQDILYTSNLTGYTLHKQSHRIYSTQAISQDILYTSNLTGYTLHKQSHRIYSTQAISQDILYTSNLTGYTLQSNLTGYTLHKQSHRIYSTQAILLLWYRVMHNLCMLGVLIVDNQTI